MIEKYKNIDKSAHVLIDEKNGITEPREPITFPYLTTEKAVP